MDNPTLVYLDHAATSRPKPEPVKAAMIRFIDEVGANPGRSGHRLSLEAGRVLYAAREAVCELFQFSDPLRVVFGSNVTEALNLALCGLLRPGDHVITSSMEHNSMMRPLRALEKEGVELTVLPCTQEGVLDPGQAEGAIRSNTKVIALIHASNVVGTLLPVAEVGRIARRHKLLFLVDTAATAGAVPIRMEEDGIDLLAFTGHKYLLGPMGTGGLIVGERVDLQRFKPMKRGGTGSRSEHEEQPDFLPDLLESGTPNVLGLAGLEAGIRWVLDRGAEAIRAHFQELARCLIHGLSELPGVRVHGTKAEDKQTATVSFTLDGLSPSEVGMRLDEEHGILCRAGLHCAPAAHRTMKTFKEGTIRFSPGIFTTKQDVEKAICAMARIAGGEA